VPAELADNAASRRNGDWRWQAGARLEQVASLSSIVAAAQRSVDDGEKTALADVKGELAIDDVLAAAHDGDKFALSLVRAVGCVHGWVAHQVNELFNPEKIIFAGPLADLGDLFLTSAREMARKLGDADRDLVIVNSTLGQYNGAVGAAALALHQWKPKR
jgi:predicted NBD/HSP70 family sugar kinase